MENLDEKINSELGENNAYSLEERMNAGKAAYRSPKYNAIHFIVHPGWAPNTYYDEEWESDRRKDIFLQEFYQDYITNLGGELDRAARRDEPVHVIYDGGMRSHAETLINKITEEMPEILAYTKSVEQSGSIPKNNIPELEETLELLDQGGETIVHGEICGRCDQIFKNNLRDLDSNLNIRKGNTFPPEQPWTYVFEK